MDAVVVTNDNVKQIVQALFENCKSNQHRLDEIEPMLKQMADQTNKLTTLLVDNGYAMAVKNSSKEVTKLRTDFNQYVMDRDASCPVAKRLHKEKQDSDSRKNWTATTLRVVFAAIGGLATVTVLVQSLMKAMGG